MAIRKVMNHPRRRRLRRSIFIVLKGGKRVRRKFEIQKESLSGVERHKARHEGIQIGLGISRTARGKWGMWGQVVNKTGNLVCVRQDFWS
jgi:hypothetical protein